MGNLIKAIVLVCATFLCAPLVWSDDAAAKQTQTTLNDLKTQIETLKADYEKRIKDLESQVEQLQVQLLQAPTGEEAPAPPPAVVQSIPGALNPAISVASNFVSRSDSQEVFNEDGNRIDNKMNLREAEVDFRVPIDPYADGVLITSFESETPGQYSVDVEEGYVNLKKLPFWDRPPLGLKLQVGRFRPDFGQNNVLHTHDLPTTFRPLPIQEFLGQDGWNANGVAANFFIPTWDQNSNLGANVDILTGGNIALSPDLSARVAYLGHLLWYHNLNDANSLQVGFSTSTDPANSDATEKPISTVAISFIVGSRSVRANGNRSCFGGEFMFARKAYPDAQESPDVTLAIQEQNIPAGTGKPFGYTLWGQWQFNRRIYAGTRWDQTDILYNPDFVRKSLTPYVSYYFSEFLRFRVDYEHRWSDLVTENGRNSLYLELNWIFGSHPPEPFWVNK